MKKLGLAILTAAAVAGMTATAFAGEWELSDAGWKYKNDDGTYKKSEWFLDEDTGDYFLFSNDGIMMTGDVTVDGVPYYFNEDGSMARNVFYMDTQEVATDDGAIFKIGGDSFLVGQFVAAGEDGNILYLHAQNYGGKPLTLQNYVELTGDGIEETWYTYDINTETFGKEVVIDPMAEIHIPVVAQDLHKVDFVTKAVDAKVRYAMDGEIYWLSVPVKQNVEGQHLLIKGYAE